MTMMASSTSNATARSSTVGPMTSRMRVSSAATASSTPLAITTMVIPPPLPEPSPARAARAPSKDLPGSPRSSRTGSRSAALSEQAAVLFVAHRADHPPFQVEKVTPDRLPHVPLPRAQHVHVERGGRPSDLQDQAARDRGHGQR